VNTGQPPQFLSEQREVERCRDLMARLVKRKENVRQAAAILPDIVRQQAKIWKHGEPPAFDKFCYLLDGNAMFQRQAQVWDEAGILKASQILSPTRTIQELVLIHGKRSGKDYCAAKFVAYIVYILHELAMPPCQYMAEAGNLALDHHTRIDIPNVAPNEDLGKQVFFQYLKKFLSAPLFLGIPVYPPPQQWKPGTEEIIFPSIDLHLYSKSSESSGLDGYNVFVFVIDEGDSFRRQVVDGIHDIFRRTMLSTYGRFGIGLNISYPRDEEGYMLTLAERARKSPHLFYVDVAATHEVRPDFNLDDPVIVEEFENDPRGARAMYLCEPVSVTDAFFTMPERITAAVDQKATPIAVFEREVIYTPLKTGEVLEAIGGKVYDFKPEPGCVYFLGGDGGKKRDSFVLSVWHINETGEATEWFCPACATSDLLSYAVYTQCDGRETFDLDTVYCGRCGGRPRDMQFIPTLAGWWHLANRAEGTISIGGMQYHVPRIYEDLLIEFAPEYSTRKGQKNRPVDFLSVTQVSVEIVRALRIQRARFDPWNCASIIGTIQAQTGCDAQEISFSNPEQYRRAKLVKKLLYDNLLTLLPNEKRDREWRRLQDLNGKVDHPPIREGQDVYQESKDHFDAESIAIWLAATWSCTALEVEWL
jgi:hypothetical protein